MAAGSILSIIAAALVPAIIGYAWYHPRFFGGVWMRLSNVSPEMAERAGKRKHLYFILGIGANLFIAYAIASLGEALGVVTIPESISFACLLWVGFVAPVSLGMVLWNHQSLRLYAITGAYWLLCLLSMSIIVVL